MVSESSQTIYAIPFKRNAHAANMYCQPCYWVSLLIGFKLSTFIQLLCDVFAIFIIANNSKAFVCIKYYVKPNRSASEILEKISQAFARHFFFCMANAFKADCQFKIIIAHDDQSLTKC